MDADRSFDTVPAARGGQVYPPCVFIPATSCTPVSEICSPSGAFIDGQGALF
jgi:hypothetical protein